MDGVDDPAWLQALDENACLNAQIIHLQESCTFRVNNSPKSFNINLTGDGKLMMVTNGGGKRCWGCPDASGLVPIEDTVNKIQWGAFLRSVCIRIGDYTHARCRVTNAFKKRLIETFATLMVGVIGVRQIAHHLADIWSTLLADVKPVAPTDRLFQRSTKLGQFDINTSMLFLTDPKYQVRILIGLGNHFPNTMYGCISLWTLIEVLLRNMRCLYALWRQRHH